MTQSQPKSQNPGRSILSSQGNEHRTDREQHGLILSEQELSSLAKMIYQRLRQELRLERERQA